jgi:phospholipid/cholesterol/gamma-HCH transport system substrate-binding protein
VIAKRRGRIILAVSLVAILAGGIALATTSCLTRAHKNTVIGYFANSNGIFTGDEVRILGVRVGNVDKIEPQPDRVKITFSYDDKYHVPANAEAVILSPSLVTARAVQLTPAYTDGAVMADGAVIPEERTAVPVEWDDLRVQLQKLTDALQPTEPGGVSTLGAFINTTADNLRGQGANIRDTVIKLSQALSVLGDHSGDVFSTVKSLSIVVSALQSSTDLMRQLNRNLAGVTSLLASDPQAIATAVDDVNAAAGQVQTFVSDNREALGTTSDKLASVSRALVDSLDDIKQLLHIAPTAFANFNNIYQPAQGSITGSFAANNFADPISFLCGAVQAASRLGAEQSAKLCVQYLAPIVKNRQYNFPPLGNNFIVGAQARPNEVTYSEDWMRPDYVPPPAPAPAPGNPPSTDPGPPPGGPLPAEAAATDPAAGLPGMMVPPGGGS